MSDIRFDGRVAVVTGAGGNPGLGRSYALMLAARGAKVVVNDLGVGPDGRGAIGEGVNAVVKEIQQAGGEAVANGGSVASRDGAAEIVQTAIDTWGRVDIIVNNAGIAPFARFHEISDRDIERVVDVHLMGHIWMCRAAWPQMTRQRYGRLVNISSTVAVIGMPYQSIYAASKLGIVGLTRALAAEGAEFGIKANAVMPTADTLAFQTMLEPGFSEWVRGSGMVPDAVAPVVAWLAHEGCPVSGKILQTQAGGINEVFFSNTTGTEPQPDLTPELIGSRLDRIIDRSQAENVPDPTGDVPPGMKPKPYEPTG